MSTDEMKKMIKRIVVLPPVPTLLICVPSYGMVIYALTGESVNPAIAYVSYGLSAYALIITVTGITGVARFVRQGIDQNPLVRRALSIPLVRRYLGEDVFRAKASLYQGFFINLLYAGINSCSGILYGSAWFATLAVYYILLALMRASLLHCVRRGGDDKASEWRRYRLCGIILLFMNVCLAGMVVLVVHENSGFEYPGMLIYVMAMYTFYAAITAVRNVVKSRRYKSPVMSAAKVVSLTAALVSVLSLETAMVTRFGAADDPDFRQMMSASTGAGISAVVLVMAVFMIARSTAQLNAMKAGTERRCDR